MPKTGLENNNKPEIVGQFYDIKILRPDPAAISLSEGLHLEVVDENDIPWRQQSEQTILMKASFALLVAKIICEERKSPDLWANFQLNSHVGFDKSINVFGRNSNSEISWGKSVKMREVFGEQVPSSLRIDLNFAFDQMLPAWSDMLSNIELFDGKISQLSMDDSVYVEEANLYAKINEKIIWANEKFSIFIVQYPHLTGLHLVIHPNEKYWNDNGGFIPPWSLDQLFKIRHEQIMGFIEAEAILLGCERVLVEQESDLLFYNPEIHFSGNWALGHKEKINLKKIKSDYFSHHHGDIRKVKVDNNKKTNNKFDSSKAIHGHLYATRDPSEFVNLPSRPEVEVPEEWIGIAPLSIEEEEKIEDIVNQKLASWLEQNAKGPIINQTS